MRKQSLYRQQSISSSISSLCMMLAIIAIFAAAALSVSASTVTFVPNSNNAYTVTGTMTETTSFPGTPSSGTEDSIDDACYSALNVSDATYCKSTTGTSALDTFFRTDITMPSGTIVSVAIKGILKTNLGVDRCEIALYNYTSDAWKSVNQSAAACSATANTTLTFNVTGVLLNDFVAPWGAMRFALDSRGGSLDTLNVTYMEAVVTYQENINFTETKSNSSIYVPNASINFSTITGSNINLKNYTFEWNATGSNCDGGFINVTNSSLSGTLQQIDVIKTIPEACAGKLIRWRIYTNNTDNLWNYTESNFTVETMQAVVSTSKLAYGNGTTLNARVNLSWQGGSAIPNKSISIVLINSTGNIKDSYTTTVDVNGLYSGYSYTLPKDEFGNWTINVTGSFSNSMNATTQLNFSVQQSPLASNIWINFTNPFTTAYGYCNASGTSDMMSYDYYWYGDNELISSGTTHNYDSLGTGYQTCAIRANDSRVLCWGYNYNGELGDNTTISKNVLTLITDQSPYLAISAGPYNTCGIRANDSRVLCWGDEYYQQIGDGTPYLDRNTSTLVNDTEPYSMISVGYHYTCGIHKLDRKLLCWGRNDFGQLGTGDISIKSSPTHNYQDTEYLSVSTGSEHACAIRANDSRILCWGNGYGGRLGDGTAISSRFPKLVNDTSAYSSISVGNRHSCAIRANDSRVLCWGENFYGEIGDGINVSRYNPTLINDTNKYLTISAGAYFTCGLRAADKAIFCWGYNENGKLGNGNTIDQINPTRINDSSEYIGIKTGIVHTCGIRANDSRVLCWGNNGNGAIGDNTTIHKYNPTLITESFPAIDFRNSLESRISSLPSQKIIGKNTIIMQCCPSDGIVGGMCSNSSSYSTVDPLLEMSMNQTVALNGTTINISGNLTWTNYTPIDGKYVTLQFANQSGTIKLEHNATTDSSGKFSYKYNVPSDEFGEWKVFSTGKYNDSELNSKNVTFYIKSIPKASSIRLTREKGSSIMSGYCSAESYNNDVIFDYTVYRNLTEFSKETVTEYNKLSIGWSFICRIRANDSKVLCSGYNTDGQIGNGTSSAITPALWPALTIDNTSYDQISSGWAHSCGIRSNDSRVLCWGTGGYGQLGDGNISSRNSSTLINDSSPYLTISAGANYVCGIRANDSRVLCWGEGMNGKLGYGASTDKYNPTLINSTSQFRFVSAGYYHTCAIRANDSRVLCWGRNAYGQLGIGNTTNIYNPILINDTNAYKSVYAGYDDYTCGIRANDSRVLCWGRNNYGQLANDSTAGQANSPQLIIDTSAYNSLSSNKLSSSHTCGIRANDSRVLCWGYNGYGQLGLGAGNTTNMYTPTLINDTNPYYSVHAAGTDTCAIRANDSKVLCWGSNSQGQHGDGTLDPKYSPYMTSAIVNKIGFNSNNETLLKILYPTTMFSNDDVTLQCCPREEEFNGTCINVSRSWIYDIFIRINNSQLLLGGSTFSTTINFSWENGNPVSGKNITVILYNASGDMKSIQNVTTDSNGYYNYTYLLPGYEVGLWNITATGIYNDSITDTIASNFIVSTMPAITNISAYSVSSSVHGFCTGNASFDSLKYNYTWFINNTIFSNNMLYNTQAITLGYDHTCIIRSNDSRVLCWGYNNYGQLGDNTTAQRNTSTEIFDSSEYKMISAGQYHTCAIRANDSRVLCWGYNLNGRLGDGTTTNRNISTLTTDASAYSSVSAGTDHTCGIRANDSRILCWGNNAQGQLGNGSATGQKTSPSLINNTAAYIAVTTGYYHTCAIRANDSRVLCWGYNNYGQAGIGNNSPNQRVNPILINDTSPYNSIFAGNTYTCGIRANDSRVLCWGYNGYGQLGLGTGNTTNMYNPTLINDSAAYDLVISNKHSALSHTCGIRANDSRALCWGYNGYGQLGTGNTTQLMNPTLVNYSTPFISFEVGYDHTCGVEENDSRILCWGRNNYGEIGDNTTSQRNLPTLPLNSTSAAKFLSLQEAKTSPLYPGIANPGDEVTLQCCPSDDYYNGTCINSSFIVNQPPTTLNTAITPLIPSSKTDLQGWCNGTGGTLNGMQYYWILYRNGTLSSSGIANNSEMNYTKRLLVNVVNISNSLTANWDNWTLSCMTSDLITNGSWINYSILINNTAPNITGIAINSTYGYNTTYENISTAFNATDLNSDLISKIYDWRINGTSLAVVNMNFDVNDSAGSGKTRDYSTYQNNGTISNAAWNATGGRNESGAYSFDGTNSVITLSDYSSTNFKSGDFYVGGWFYFRSNTGYQFLIDHRGSADATGWVLYVETGVNQVNFAAATTTGWDKTVGAFTPSTDTWTHIAVTRVGNNWTMFRDGQAYASYTYSTAIGDTTIQPTIGRGHVTGTLQGFNGYMDDIIIANTTVTPQQVYSIYSNRTDLITSSMLQKGQAWSVCVTPNDGQADGNTICSSNVTINQGPLTIQSLVTPTIAYTSDALTGWCNATNDLSSNVSFDLRLYKNGVLNWSGTYSNATQGNLTAVVSISPYTAKKNEQWILTCIGKYDLLESTAINSSALTINNTLPTLSSIVISSSSGLNTTRENISVSSTKYDTDSDQVNVVYDWRINGTSIAVLNMNFDVNNSGGFNKTRDYSMFGNNGTSIVNADWNATGGWNGTGAYKFNGASSYIDIPNSATFDMQRFTISADVYSSSFDQDGHIFEKGPQDSQYSLFFYSGNDNIYFRTINSGVVLHDLTVNYATAGIKNNSWNHIAAAYDGSYKYIYVNGVQVANVSYSQTIRTGQSGERIGAYGGGAPSYYFNGYIDNLRVYNRSLSAQEIQMLFSNKTDMLSSQEIYKIQNWSVCLTPNDGQNDGSTSCSANLTTTPIYPNCPDTEGDWIVSSNQALNTNISCNNIIVNSGSTLTVNYNVSINASSFTITGNSIVTTGSLYYLNITATNITIDSGSSINVNAKGYAGGGNTAAGSGPGGGAGGGSWIGGSGGTYGGYGGAGTSNSQNTVSYGHIMMPILPGSGGGGAMIGGGGGTGAGAVVLTGTNVVVNGSIVANGNPGIDGQSGGGGYAGAGGGAGGSIWITASLFNGTGTITANGGGGGINAYYGGGGGGAGGRVSILYALYGFTGTLALNGGSQAGSASTGGAGTLFKCQSTSNVSCTTTSIENISLLTSYNNNISRNITRTIFVDWNQTSIRWNESASAATTATYILQNLTYPNYKVQLNGTFNNSVYPTSNILTLSIAIPNGELAILAPNDTAPILNVMFNGSRNLPGMVYTDENLTCYANMTDLDDFNMSMYITIFNGSAIFNQSVRNVSSNNSYAVFMTVDNSYTNIAENWTCQVVLGDSYYNTSVNASRIINTNTIPIIRTANITPVVAYANDTLQGWCNATDDDGNSLSYYYQWYKNGVLNASGFADNGGVNFTQGVQSNVVNMTGHVRSQTWIFGCRAFDGNENTSWLNSSGVTINNSMPQVTGLVLNSTLGLNSTNENLTAYVAGVDYDVDNISYAYDWRLNVSSIAVINMNFDVNNSAGTNKTRDYSSYQNNGTIYGAAAWGQNYGSNNTGAYLFDGNNDYIEIEESPSTYVGSRNFTVVVRAYINNTAGAKRIIDNDNTGAGYTSYLIAQNTNGLYLWASSTGSSWDIISGIQIGTVSAGQWYTIVIMRNGTNFSTYLNDVPGASTTSSATLYNGTRGIVLGRNSGAGSEYFSGIIDDVRVYDRALARQELSALYNNRTNTIVSQGLTAGQNWSVCITPNDGVSEGNTNCTGNVSITQGIVTIAANITPTTAYAADTLKGWCNGTYASSIDYSWIWFKNGAINSSGTTSSNYTQGVLVNVANISSMTTKRADAWIFSCQAVNGVLTGSWMNSTTVTISNSIPQINSVILNSTTGLNLSSDNLTAYITSQDNDSETVRYAKDWRANGTSIAVLNMNFDVNNSAGTGKTRDYSTYQNNGTISSATWTSTGGYNGSGAYDFNTGYIYIPPSSSLSLSSFTLSTKFTWRSEHPSHVYRTLLSRSANDDQGYHDNYLMYVADAGRTINVRVGHGSSEDYWTGPAVDDSKLHHAIFTFNGATGNGILYVDGVIVHNRTGIAAAYTGATDTLIGAWKYSGGYYGAYDGIIDDVQIYNRALTPQEVGTIFNNETMIVSQEVVGRQNWSICVTPNDGNADGTAVCSSNLTITSGPSTKTPTILPTTAYANDTLVGYCNATNDIGSTVDYSYSWFKNGALNTSGSASGISQNINSNLNNISALTAKKGEQWIFSCQASSAGLYGSWMNSSTLTISNYNPTISSLVVNSTTGLNITADNLTAYAQIAEYDNDTVRACYDWRINGTSIAVVNMNFDVNNSGGSGKTRDYSTYSNNGTVNGNSWTPNGGVNGSGAYSITSTATSVSIPDSNSLDITNNLTLSVWLYPTAEYVGYATKPVNKWYGTTNANYVMYYFGTTSGVSKNIGFYATAGGSWSSISGQYNLPLNQWTHVVVAYSSTDGGQLYINGTAVGSLTGSGALTTNTYPLALGVDQLDITYFPGSIDEFKLYNRTLSAQEIAAIYANKTNFIASQELANGQNWSVCITPNDGISDGSTNCSGNITIVQAQYYANCPNTNGDWTVSTSQALNTNISCRNVIINSGAILTINNNASINASTVTITGSSTITTGLRAIVNLTAENITIASGSSISVVGKGLSEGTGLGNGTTGPYQKGAGGAAHAGYGGQGGSSGGAGSTITHGDAVLPILFGSGGGIGYNGAGGTGGGIIRIFASNTLTNNGTISANANDGTNGGSFGSGGGGAGGSIIINTSTFTGTGTINANGGAGGGGSYIGGAGSGGRISISYVTSSYSGLLDSKGGTGAANGGAGTVYLLDKNTNTDTIIVNNYNIGIISTNITGSSTKPSFSNIVLNGTNVLCTTLNVTNSITTMPGTANIQCAITGSSNITFNQTTVAIASSVNCNNLLSISSTITTPNSMTFNVNDTFNIKSSSFTTSASLVPITINSSNAFIDSGSSINAAGKGYGSNGGPSPGASGGAVTTGGGAHGGVGGSAGTAGGTPAYGDMILPITYGSGSGGNGWQGGSSGGGAIRITTSVLQNNGTITSNGNAGTCSAYSSGGGAGGSIALNTMTMSGTGTITAVGGNGCSGSGGGGGGRISMSYNNYTYSGTISVAAGTGGSGAGAGTLFRCQANYNMTCPGSIRNISLNTTYSIISSQNITRNLTMDWNNTYATWYETATNTATIATYHLFNLTNISYNVKRNGTTLAKYTASTTTLGPFNVSISAVQILVEPYIDTCTPPGSGDWVIKANDYCVKTGENIVITGKLIINGTSGAGSIAFHNSNITANDFNIIGGGSITQIILDQNSKLIRPMS